MVRDNLYPIIEVLEKREPHDLVTTETWFPNETAARGFVWTLFINAVNEQSNKTITLDIDDIKDVKDMELFFSLIYRERILYHPDFSFNGYMNTDINRNHTVRTFSDEESKRLDMLNKKCFEVARREKVNIYKSSLRIQKMIWGDPDKKISKMENEVYDCQHCGGNFEDDFCEKCSVRCPICNEIIGSFQDFDFGGYEVHPCEHVIGYMLRVVSDEIFWEDREYENKFEAFWELNSVQDESEIDYVPDPELLRKRVDALEEFAKTHGLTLLYHEDQESQGAEDITSCLIIEGTEH